MASRSGRVGSFDPESKELMVNSVQKDGPIDEDEKDLEADRAINERLVPRRLSRSTPPATSTATSQGIPKACIIATEMQPPASGNNNGTMNPKNVAGIPPNTEEGCKVCRRDVDHPNLLLCEACNDEYHTYCLNPPLQCVPEGDFFCDKCKRIHIAKDDDGLDSLVSALPPAYTSRFGEIVWAAGGVGFGWWPACVYDPRLTVGGARQLARKNLGKRHLIYFFECNEAPFTVLGDNRLTKWEDGFIEEYDLGKVAKSGGKNRFTHFERALQVAQLEHGRPIEMRMDWNHQEVVPLPKIVKQKQPSNLPLEQLQTKRQKQSPSLKRSTSSTSLLQNIAAVNRKNLDAAIDSLNNRGEANAIEQLEDGILVCKILRRLPAGRECNAATQGMEFSNNLGFVTLPSRQSATFAAIRRAVESDLDDDMLPPIGKKRWRFYVPKLGPMSVKQEGKLGAALEFLKSTTDDTQLGDGTASNPLKIILMDV